MEEPLGPLEPLEEPLGPLEPLEEPLGPLEPTLGLEAPLDPSLGLEPPLDPRGPPQASPPGCLSWFPYLSQSGGTSPARLAYATHNFVHILEMDPMPPSFDRVLAEVKDKDRALPTLPIRRVCLWRAPAAVSALQWLSASILCVFGRGTTILYYDGALTAVGQGRAAPGAAPRALRDKLVVLGPQGVAMGALVNWADILAALLPLQPLEALRLAARYYGGGHDRAVVAAGLPRNAARRRQLVEPYLVDIMATQVALCERDDAVALYLEVLAQLPQTAVLESVYAVAGERLFAPLEPHLLSGDIRVLPPAVLQGLVAHYVARGEGDVLTQILCVVDLGTLDVDATVQLCRRHGLVDALVYIYNVVLGDYETPLVELVRRRSPRVFPYIAYILTGRQYPTSRAAAASARHAVATRLFALEGGAFPMLTRLLHQDSFAMLAALNEYFETPALNDDAALSRQYVVDALLDVFAGEFSAADRCHLAIFVARNYPKYPQFIRLLESCIEGVISTLCANTSAELVAECELALQSLIGHYDPAFDAVLVAKLRAARFWDVLMGVYRAEGRHAKVVETWLEKGGSDLPVAAAFEATRHHTAERIEVQRTVRAHFAELAAHNVAQLVAQCQRFDPLLHLEVRQLDDATASEYGTELLRRVPAARVALAVVVRYLEALLRRNQLVAAFMECHWPAVRDAAEWRQALAGVFARYGATEALATVQMAEGEYEAALTGLLASLRSDRGGGWGRRLDLAMRVCLECQQTRGGEREVEGLGLNERLWLRLVGFCVEVANGPEATEPLAEPLAAPPSRTHLVADATLATELAPEKPLTALTEAAAESLVTEAPLGAEHATRSLLAAEAPEASDAPLAKLAAALQAAAELYAAPTALPLSGGDTALTSVVLPSGELGAALTSVAPPSGELGAAPTSVAPPSGELGAALTSAAPSMAAAAAACLQQTFRHIASLCGDRSLLAIFNAILADSSAAKLAHVRGVLQQVFVQYSHEVEILNICLRLLHGGITKSMKVVRAAALCGLAAARQCASCAKPMWGDVPPTHWVAWEELQTAAIRRDGAARAASLQHHRALGLVLFACGHGFHRPCWEGLGSGDCPVCL